MKNLILSNIFIKIRFNLSLIWTIGSVPCLLLDKNNFFIKNSSSFIFGSFYQNTDFSWISSESTINENKYILILFLLLWFLLLFFIAFINLGIVSLLFILEVGMFTPIISLSLLGIVPLSSILFLINAITMEAVIGVIVVLYFIKDWKFKDFTKNEILESNFNFFNLIYFSINKVLIKINCKNNGIKLNSWSTNIIDNCYYIKSIDMLSFLFTIFYFFWYLLLKGYKYLITILIVILYFTYTYYNYKYLLIFDNTAAINYTGISFLHSYISIITNSSNLYYEYSKKSPIFNNFSEFFYLNNLSLHDMIIDTTTLKIKQIPIIKFMYYGESLPKNTFSTYNISIFDNRIIDTSQRFFYNSNPKNTITNLNILSKINSNFNLRYKNNISLSEVHYFNGNWDFIKIHTSKPTSLLKINNQNLKNIHNFTSYHNLLDYQSMQIEIAKLLSLDIDSTDSMLMQHQSLKELQDLFLVNRNYNMFLNSKYSKIGSSASLDIYSNIFENIFNSSINTTINLSNYNDFLHIITNALDYSNNFEVIQNQINTNYFWPNNRNIDYNQFNYSLFLKKINKTDKFSKNICFNLYYYKKTTINLNFILKNKINNIGSVFIVRYQNFLKKKPIQKLHINLNWLLKVKELSINLTSKITIFRSSLTNQLNWSEIILLTKPNNILDWSDKCFNFIFDNSTKILPWFENTNHEEKIYDLSLKGLFKNDFEFDEFILSEVTKNNQKKLKLFVNSSSSDIDYTKIYKKQSDIFLEEIPNSIWFEIPDDTYLYALQKVTKNKKIPEDLEVHAEGIFSDYDSMPSEVNFLSDEDGEEDEEKPSTSLSIDDLDYYFIDNMDKYNGAYIILKKNTNNRSQFRKKYKIWKIPLSWGFNIDLESMAKFNYKNILTSFYEDKIYLKRLSKINSNFSNLNQRALNKYEKATFSDNIQSLYSSQSRGYGFLFLDFFNNSSNINPIYNINNGAIETKLIKNNKKFSFKKLQNSFRLKKKYLNYIGNLSNNLKLFDFFFKKKNTKIPKELLNINTSMREFNNGYSNIDITNDNSELFLSKNLQLCDENSKIKFFWLPTDNYNYFNKNNFNGKKIINDRFLKTFKKLINNRKINTTSLLNRLDNHLIINNKVMRFISNTYRTFQTKNTTKKENIFFNSENYNKLNFIKNKKITVLEDTEIFSKYTRSGLKKPHTVYGILWDEYLKQTYGFNLNFLNFNNKIKSNYEVINQSYISSTSNYLDNFQKKLENSLNQYNDKLGLTKDSEIGNIVTGNLLPKVGFIKEVSYLSNLDEDFFNRLSQPSPNILNRWDSEFKKNKDFRKVNNLEYDFITLNDNSFLVNSKVLNSFDFNKKKKDEFDYSFFFDNNFDGFLYDSQNNLEVIPKSYINYSSLNNDYDLEYDDFFYKNYKPLYLFNWSDFITNYFDNTLDSNYTNNTHNIEYNSQKNKNYKKNRILNQNNLNDTNFFLNISNISLDKYTNINQLDWFFNFLNYNNNSFMNKDKKLVTDNLNSIDMFNFKNKKNNNFGPYISLSDDLLNSEVFFNNNFDVLDSNFFNFKDFVGFSSLESLEDLLDSKNIVESVSSSWDKLLLNSESSNIFRNYPIKNLLYVTDKIEKLGSKRRKFYLTEYQNPLQFKFNLKKYYKDDILKSTILKNKLLKKSIKLKKKYSEIPPSFKYKHTDVSIKIPYLKRKFWIKNEDFYSKFNIFKRKGWLSTKNDNKNILNRGYFSNLWKKKEEEAEYFKNNKLYNSILKTKYLQINSFLDFSTKKIKKKSKNLGIFKKIFKDRDEDFFIQNNIKNNVKRNLNKIKTKIQKFDICLKKYKNISIDIFKKNRTKKLRNYRLFSKLNLSEFSIIGGGLPVKYSNSNKNIENIVQIDLFKFRKLKTLGNYFLLKNPIIQLYRNGDFLYDRILTSYKNKQYLKNKNIKKNINNFKTWGLSELLKNKTPDNVFFENSLSKKTKKGDFSKVYKLSNYSNTFINSFDINTISFWENTKFNLLLDQYANVSNNNYFYNFLTKIDNSDSIVNLIIVGLKKNSMSGSIDNTVSNIDLYENILSSRVVNNKYTDNFLLNKLLIQVDYNFDKKKKKKIPKVYPIF